MSILNCLARRAKIAATLMVVLLVVAGESRAQSALDGFDPGANAAPFAMAMQADGKILVAGVFTTLGGGGIGTTTRNHLGRLNPDGTLDSGFNPGANNTVQALAVQADGKILVVGNFTTLGGGGTGTTTRNYIGRLNPDGSLDTSFNPGANNWVVSLAVQADGKILVGGFFTTLGGGGTGTTARNGIGRLNPDGSLDASFNPGANGYVGALAVQGDGKILVGGGFTALGGGTGTTTRNRIGRLNPDGTLEPGFNPGANDTVTALAVQPDGKVLVVGLFTGLGGGTGTTTRNRIGRLNPDGSLDPSFNPGANNTVNALAVQTDGKILLGGHFTGLGGGSGTTTRNYLGRLNADGTLDPSFNPGANSILYSLAVQADGKILAGGSFTTLGSGTGTVTRNSIGRLHPDGTLDANFDPGASHPDPLANHGWIASLVVQADGKIVVGGYFTTLGGGGTGTTPRNYLGRLNPDGTLDSSFNPGANGRVETLAVQADGKILVGGFFTTLGGGGGGTSTRNHIGRLNPDGTLDLSFDPGADRYVNALAVQADGKILVGGDFTGLGGGTGTTPRSRIGRLNPDGSLDTSFDPGAFGEVHTVEVQADGKILVGGNFSRLGGGTGTTTRNKIGRLNPDGTLDTSFDPGANTYVITLVEQADGKILVAGTFTTLGGGGTGTTTRNRIGRLNPDGTLDTSFNPGANSYVDTVAIQADGKILVGGPFTTLGGGGTGNTQRNYIGRLNPDGTVDPSFDPGANTHVYALAVQADGKIVVGGNFSTLGGGGAGTTTRNRIGRLTNTAAALQSLTVPTGTSINWSRSSTSPEVDRVTFELSTDALNYTALGNPIRIGGGWQLTGQNLPTQQNFFIRARGVYSAGGIAHGSGIIETVRNAFISPTPSPQCSDSLDNDADGLVDMADPGCSSPQDDSESPDPTPPQCSDSIDNDGDGLVDMADPDCSSPQDNSEAPVPTPTQVVSRKLHSGAPFDIDLPLTGNSGIECRSGGASNDYQMVLTFAGAVTFNSASITSGTGSVSSSSGSGTSTVTVNLTGITNAQRITVTLAGLSNGSNTGDLGVQMGVLLGDTNDSGGVGASDISQTKAQSGQAVTATNFRTDVNASGTINATDISLVKSKSGTFLP